ncbi:MAG: hypothetical protein ABI947_10605 [Chloroflexota bacterium]
MIGGTNSKTTPRPIDRLQQLPWLIVALIAYYLPWVYHKTAALTANAYDLAEWVSIYPTVRGGNPPLLDPFLLRGAMAGLALLFALRAARGGWLRWLYIVLSLLLVITLLPPLDFFRNAGDDPNYRQQFIISLATLIGDAAIWWIYTQRRHWLPRLEIVVLLLTVIAAIVGEVLALDIERLLGLNVTIGGGVVVFVASLMVVLVGRAILVY